MKLKNKSPGVYITEEDIVQIDRSVVELLRREAPTTLLKRARFNAHPGAAETVQEMIIALARDTYIPPHKHFGKPESFHIIEGELDIVIFEEDGSIRKIIRMGDCASGKTFYYRSSLPVFHAVVVRSEIAIFQETTQGPFIKGETVFGPWAPESEGPDAVRYLADLRKAIDSIMLSKQG